MKDYRYDFDKRSDREAFIQRMKNIIERNTLRMQELGFGVETVCNPEKIDRSKPNWKRAFEMARYNKKCKINILSLEAETEEDYLNLERELLNWRRGYLKRDF